MRYNWIDTAKGMAIVFVVVAHAAAWIGLGDTPYPVITLVQDVGSAIMLPIFFAASGLFAQRPIAGDMRALWSSRLALFVWPFLLWQPVVFAYKLVGDRVMGGGAELGLLDHVVRAIVFPLRPNGELWYLWGLALMFLVAKVVARFPARVVLTAAGVVSIGWSAVAPLLPGGLIEGLGVGYAGIARFTVFFLIGLYWREQLLGAIERLRPLVAGVIVVVGLAFIITLSILRLHNAPILESAYFGVGFIVGLVAARYFIPAGTPLQAIGGKWTMPVFLSHTAFIVAVGAVLHLIGYRFAPDRIDSYLVFFAVVAAAVVFGVTVVGRMKWSWYPPAWFTASERR